MDNEFEHRKGLKLYLAISGGKDSMALSHLLLSSGYNHTLLHCNFKLRGEESEEDETFIKQYAKQNDLELKVNTFNTTKSASDLNLSIQETARKLRYDWFHSILKTDKNAILLTAHHLDDSIETFFINLLRGTSIKGLSGIRKKDTQHFRPLLEFSTEDILEYIDTNGILFRKDSSNDQNKYLRNKLRNQIIPELNESTSNFKSKIKTTMNSMQMADQWINKEVSKFKEKYFIKINEYEIAISITELLQTDTFLLSKVFETFDLRRTQLNELNEFIHISKKGSVLNTNEFVLYKDNKYIRVSEQLTSIQPIIILEKQLPKTFQFGKKTLKIYVSNQSIPLNQKHIQQVNIELIKFPLTIRCKTDGDTIKPLGMNGNKKVSDVFIDKKLSAQEKNTTPIILDNSNTIVGLFNLVVSDLYKISASTNNRLVIEQISS